MSVFLIKSFQSWSEESVGINIALFGDLDYPEACFSREAYLSSLIYLAISACLFLSCSTNIFLTFFFLAASNSFFLAASNSSLSLSVSASSSYLSRSASSSAAFILLHSESVYDIFCHSSMSLASSYRSISLISYFFGSGDNVYQRGELPIDPSSKNICLIRISPAGVRGSGKGYSFSSVSGRDSG